VTLNRVTGESFWNAIATHQPTYLKFVPSMIKLIDGSGVPPAAASVARISLGSAATGKPDVARLREMFPNARIYVDYSSTESGRATLVARVDDYESTGWEGELGTPRFGGDVRLVAEDGSVIDEPGVPGEIQLRRADGFTRRLITLPGQPQPPSMDGWVAMGDIGEYDDRKRLWFRCRRAEIVNVGGEKISLRSVEEVLREVPGVTDAATSAIAHSVLGSAVVALLVAAPGADPRDIRDAIALRFRGADRPCRMAFANHIPLNETGKTSRFDVAKLAADAPRQVAPVTEETLMDAVRASLGEDLSVADSIVDSGASSLNLIMLCVDLDWKFGVLLDIFDVLAAPSFRDLVQVIRERQAIASA
jgi:acyl-coenzyme A synthetase/AMP-(fatty) acid ligase/acyl carrier protein